MQKFESVQLLKSVLICDRKIWVALKVCSIGWKKYMVRSDIIRALKHFYPWAKGVGIGWNKGVWDDDVDEDVGEPRLFPGNGFDKWGRVAATNPKSSSCSPLMEEPSSLVKLSANGLGGVSCWFWCWVHVSWLVWPSYKGKSQLYLNESLDSKIY